MKRRQRTLLYATLPFSLLFILPAILDVFFPVALLVFLKLACLALVPLFILILFRKQTNNIIPAYGAQKPLPVILWLITMIILVFSVSLLFIGQLCTINQYMIQNQQMPIMLLMPWLEKTFNFVFLNPALFPWSFIALALCALFPLNHAYSSSLFSYSTLKTDLKKIVWYRAFEINISSALMALLFSSVAFCIIQISIFLSPTLNLFTHPFFSMLICSILIFLITSMKSKKFLHFLKEKRFSITSIQGMLIIICCLLGALLAGIVLKFSPAVLKQVNWQPTKTITLHYFLLSLELWSTAWWLVITPFLASFIMRISAGRSIYAVLTFLLLFPVAIFHWVPNVIPFLMKIFFLASTMLTVQLISAALLLILFVSRKANSVLQLGYFPAAPLKKERSLEIQQLLILPLCILGLIGFLGVIGLQFYFGILSFNLLISLMYVCFQRKKERA